MWGISYWIVPLFSSIVWLAMLLTMLIWWLHEGSPHYASMDPGQHIAYISDVGAQHLKPLFIAMSAVVVVTLDLSFIFERWLRHTGRLHHNTSWHQKALSILSIIFAIVGAAGLILLTIFDTLRHPHLHDIFLFLFIGGYIVSAIFICIEYQRLGAHLRDSKILRISFFIKLFFIVVELALAIAFGVMGNKHHYNTAAVLEWVVALVYTFYVFSFFVDFIPAIHTKHHQSEQTTAQMAMDSADADGTTDDHHRGHLDPEMGYSNGNANGRFYGNGTANGYTNGHKKTHSGANGYANGYTNGGVTEGAGPNVYPYQPTHGAPHVASVQPPSRNF